MKLSNRVLYYFGLFIVNIFIPIYLGKGLILLFKQPPEFILVGIILGGVLIQSIFFLKIIKRKLVASIFFGLALFILLMGLTLFLERFAFIGSFLGLFAAVKADNIWGEMIIYSIISMPLWELVYRLKQ
jgi:hypothetical protein